ncbi:hypothetical protein Cus16_2488 [Curtobacterium sp. ER1/6]|nr:hypothetical protein Cus16_2488 [Curtobacterium sp. ER1/6]
MTCPPSRQPNSIRSSTSDREVRISESRTSLMSPVESGDPRSNDLLH